MLLESVRERRVLFIGGKGGTGKTSVSSALALARAREQSRVLLVSTDPAHNLSHIWDRSLTDEATRVATFTGGSVDALEIDPDATLNEHFAAVEQMMYRMLPEEQHSAVNHHLTTARSAPGSYESATLERVAQILDAGIDQYDLVIFDTAPTGQTLHLLTLPEQLTSWLESLLANRDRSERFAAAARGLVSSHDETPTADAQLRRNLLARRDHFARMRATVHDPDVAGFIVVSLPEKLPTLETLNLMSELAGLSVNVASVVINRRSPAYAGAFYAERLVQEQQHIDFLRERIGPVPLTEIPLFTHEITGDQAVTALADYIENGTAHR